MTTVLSIPAAPDAVVACDLSAAEDTLVQRMAEYRRLFDHALESRESGATATTFRFTARPGVQDWVVDLVRREAACCPFLSYEVDQVDTAHGQQVVWTIVGLCADDMSVLDPFLAVADPDAVSSSEVARELGQRGGIPINIPAEAG